MTTYNKRTKYRKIWESHNGPIPVDSDGRTYEIHHIDGNRNNNDIENLLCLSIQEHYNIHYEQSDWRACHAISLRMNIEPSLKSELATLAAREQIASGTHNFSRRSDGTSLNTDRVADGTHNFLRRSDGTSLNTDRVADGTHHLLRRQDGSSLTGDMTKQGKIRFYEGLMAHLLEVI